MVRPAPFRVVLDTNIMVRAMVNVKSASGRILTACENRILIPLLSIRILREYRATLTHPELLTRYPELKPAKIMVVLGRLAYLGEDVLSAWRMEFPRDPRDAKFLEVAIAAQATQLITMDADLLDLRTGHDNSARQFRQLAPTTEILQPDEFVYRYESMLAI